MACQFPRLVMSYSNWPLSCQPNISRLGQQGALNTGSLASRTVTKLTINIANCRPTDLVY